MGQPPAVLPGVTWDRALRCKSRCDASQTREDPLVEHASLALLCSPVAWSLSF